MVNSYMTSIMDDLSKMYNVLQHVMPHQSIETIYSETFRVLIKSFDEYFGGLGISSKYGRKRLKLDLKYFLKKVHALKFENEELVTMINLKVNVILTANGALKEEEN